MTEALRNYFTAAGDLLAWHRTWEERQLKPFIQAMAEMIYADLMRNPPGTP